MFIIVSVNAITTMREYDLTARRKPFRIAEVIGEVAERLKALPC
jgi:hypothetical protein